MGGGVRNRGGCQNAVRGGSDVDDALARCARSLPVRSSTCPQRRWFFLLLMGTIVYVLPDGTISTVREDAIVYDAK